MVLLATDRAGNPPRSASAVDTTSTASTTLRRRKGGARGGGGGSNAPSSETIVEGPGAAAGGREYNVVAQWFGACAPKAMHKAQRRFERALRLLVPVAEASVRVRGHIAVVETHLAALDAAQEAPGEEEKRATK